MADSNPLDAVIGLADRALPPEESIPEEPASSGVADSAQHDRATRPSHSLVDGSGADADYSLSEQLLEAIENLKGSKVAATKVIQVADDQNATAQDLARAIEYDPTFTAHIIRLANSAYYGMSGRIGNTSFAVTVIGFSTVRSLATLNATGLDSNEIPKPPNFWQHAAATAAGASELAKVFGVAPSDAFAAGLMHDLGSALLFQIDPEAYVALTERYGGDGNALNAAERRTFGIGHDEAVGRVLAHWRLPEPFVEAIRGHHSTMDRNDPPFVKTIRAADRLAEATFATNPSMSAAELMALGIDQQRQDLLMDLVRKRTTEILAALPIG